MSEGGPVKVELWSDGSVRLFGFVRPRRMKDWAWELRLDVPGLYTYMLLASGNAKSEAAARTAVMVALRLLARDLFTAASKTPKGWEP